MACIGDPGKIASLEIRNRLVRSATAEGLCAADGAVTPDVVAIYRKLAEGGIGLIITGHCYVAPSGKANPGMMGLWKDDLVASFAPLLKAVHEAGARIVAQINHAGRQTTPEATGQELVAPSPIAVKGSKHTPRELTAAEIAELIEMYARAARRAKAAGFDGVQLHCAHGYLISQFISPYTNHRTDDWGGSPEKRRRFVLEVCRRVRALVGSDFPLLVKLNSADFLEGGLEIAESASLAESLEAAGVDAIEVSCGMSESFLKIARVNIRSSEKEAYLLPLAEELRRHVKIPLILVGGLRSRATMDRILADGKIDFLSMARPLIREPDLPNRLLKGQIAATCSSCNGCFQHRPGMFRCMYEEKFGEAPKPWRAG